MPSEPLYLKPNAVVEPLVDHWYAWPHLIPPATLSMNIAGRHLKIMESYLAAPEQHAAAVRDPRMLGGPFIDYEGGRVDEIRALKAETTSRCAGLLALADALRALDRMLQAKGQGHSLEPLYEEVPARLRGFVELIYDLNHRPSYRLIEALLYRSPYYREDLQSVAFYLTDRDERPFVLSTPRLPSEDVLDLAIPFSHPALDLLFASKRTPQPWPALRDALGCGGRDEHKWRSLFTTGQPEVSTPYTGSGLSIRYFGHACILVESGGTTLLADPVISYGGYPADLPRYSYADLPPSIDFVLITHGHQDHILFETLLQLRHKIKTVVVPRYGNGYLQDPSLKLMLQRIGFRNVVEIEDLEEIDFGDCKITGIPFLGEHSDLNIRSKACYHVSVNGRSLLFAADSCSLAPEMYRMAAEITGPVDALFIGTECDGAPLSWLYGPLFTDAPPRAKDFSRRLNASTADQAKRFVECFAPTQVFVYAMGQEPWLNYIMSRKYTDESLPLIEARKLIDWCRTRGIECGLLYGEKELVYSRTGTAA